jgi:chemotaxis protein MotB
MQQKPNKDPFSKLQSSLSLEDLLAQPSARNSQNWLLTYLDVFVLIVMLVITLITLSDINTEQAAANKLQATKPKKIPVCPPVVAPVLATCPPSVVANNQPTQAIAPIENKAGEPNTKTDSKDSGIAPVPTTAPEIKDSPETEANPKPAPTDAEQTADENKLQQQLAKTIDEFGLTKAINIKIAQGYAQLEIQDNVLFKSSEADLTASGGALLKRLTPLLKQSVGLILIEGHTDNIPIKTAQFPSNWELGASRATSVLHFLVLQQLDSSRLRAITYADTMPIADNSTPEGREKNRRVNILIKLSDQ